MSKKESREMIVLGQGGQELMKLESAPLVGLQQQAYIDIPLPPDVPEEFRNMSFQQATTTFPPSIKWTKVGQYVCGYLRRKEEVQLQTKSGARESNLYTLEYKGFDFSVWGGTALDRFFESGVADLGDFLQIVYVADVETNQPQPCKQFAIKIWKPKAKTPTA